VRTCTIHEAGPAPGRQRRAAPEIPGRDGALFASSPGAVERSGEIAGASTFDLSQLRYEYPDEPVPPGKTAIATCATWPRPGMHWRYPAASRRRCATWSPASST
jgi:error-prone DNA polymerase